MTPPLTLDAALTLLRTPMHGLRLPLTEHECQRLVELLEGQQAEIARLERALADSDEEANNYLRGER